MKNWSLWINGMLKKTGTQEQMESEAAWYRAAGKRAVACYFGD